MKTHPKVKWYSLLILPVLLLPFTISADDGIVVNDACADGTCCEETRSFCNIGGEIDHKDYYKKESGSCNAIET